SVLCEDGTRISYETLVIATGGRNRSLPIPGIDLRGVFSLRTMDDAARLRAQLPSARQAVVVGAGFIGLEFAAVAAANGLSVHV
ncbi:FAD-dependent oxidoreductase, partial [Oceanobacillus saliphilus]|uniref:FAD-dependent oxidoreductase n=1 Tax=Oceanobacillus saliphilus TaxID=2925834 RepID=UPI00201D2FFC